MKESSLTFIDGFLGLNAVAAAAQGKKGKAFDWNKAAKIIIENLSEHPDLKAEAGLQGDWDYTGGTIFENGNPTNTEHTYLMSNWAVPTLILSWEGNEQETIDCYEEQGKFNEYSKWDKDSCKILGIKLPKT